MNDELTNKIVEAIQSPDYLGLIVQAIGIIFPLLWAVGVSKRESDKTKKDFKAKNKILDERQEKLERIQDSINYSIEGLVSQQIVLATTQKKVEENLRELTRLSELSRNANILNMERSFSSFFEKYKIFEKNFSIAKHYRKMYLEKGEDMSDADLRELRNINKTIEDSDFLFFDSKEVPTYLYKEFENLKEALWKNRNGRANNWEEYYLGAFLELEIIVDQINRKLIQK